MKAFETWWEKQLCSNNNAYKMIAEAAWREILMQMRDKCCGVRSEDLENLNEEIIKELDG